MNLLAKRAACICVWLLWTAGMPLSAQTYEMALGNRRNLNPDWIGFNGQNMIRDSLGWQNPFLLENLPELRPKNLRYPGGGIANWWDWEAGWFVDQSDLPSAYAGLTPKENTLEHFKLALDTTGANAIFVLNMISSTLQKQLDMLQHAESIGIEVKLVELGNEFYLEGGEDSVAIISVFPTAASYAAAVNQWTDSIHHYFPDAKVAAQGAYNRNNAPRRITWDEELLPLIDDYDVVAYHAYMSASKEDENSGDTGIFVPEDIPAMLWRPFRMWDILSTEDFPLLPPGKEIWITEYNLRDHAKPVHGSWAHGLFLATQTMLLLNEPRIKHLACHAMDGTAVAGALFFNTKGYSFGSDGNFIPPPDAPEATQYWGLTAGGRAMQQLGDVLDQNKYASPLEFSDAPFITAVDGDDTVVYPALYGWAFISDDSTEALIVNLSANDYRVKTGSVFPAGGWFERYTADPMLFVAYEDDVNHKSNTELPEQLLLKAYSITKIRANTVPAPPPVITMTANGPTTFCYGDSVKLEAGATYLEYLWSTGETTKNIWVKETGDYWVRVRNVDNGFWSADTMHVTVNPAPDVPRIDNVTNTDFCDGESIKLEVKLPDDELSYEWSNGKEATSVTIKKTGTYSVTATNSFGCTAVSEEIALTELALPQPVITASGPTDICYNAEVTLDAGAGYKSYTWSNGKVGQSITVSETDSFSVTVKDSNNCYGTSSWMQVNAHEPVDADVTISGPTAFCSGSSPTYLNAPAGYLYQWQKGNNILEGATSQKYYPVDQGNYRVTISDDWGCTKKSDPVTITVYKNPSTKVTVDGDKKICVGLETVLLSAKTCSGCTYQWKLDGSNLSGATLSTYLAGLAGDYSYKVTDPNGCTSTSQKTEITNNCRSGEATVVLPETEPALTVYPNPASGSVTVAGSVKDAGEEVIIELRNTMGMLLMQEYVPVLQGNFRHQLPLKDLVNGLYILNLLTGTEVMTQRVVVQNN